MRLGGVARPSERATPLPVRGQNLTKHGIALEAADRFEWDTALGDFDDRENYGELREVAIGFIGVVLHHLTFTRRGNVIRVISLRKATQHEAKRYADEI